MEAYELVGLLRQSVEFMLRVIQDGWEISRPWLRDGAQWIADRLAQ